MKQWCNLSCVLYVPQTCLHPLCREFPPSVRFRKMFLTELIRRVGAQSDRAAGIHARLIPPPNCCRTAVNRNVFSWCRVSAAGGHRLWTPGWAVRRSGRGCRGWRHDRVLQELLTGTRKTLIIRTEQKDILDPDSDVLVLVLFFLCCSPVVKLPACWRTWLWSQEAPPAWWPGRRLSTWQSGLWITRRPSAAGTENLTWQSSWIAGNSSQNSLRSISKSSHLRLFQPVRGWSDQLASFEEKDSFLLRRKTLSPQ